MDIRILKILNSDVFTFRDIFTVYRCRLFDAPGSSPGENESWAAAPICRIYLSPVLQPASPAVSLLRRDFYYLFFDFLYSSITLWMFIASTSENDSSLTISFPWTLCIRTYPFVYNYLPVSPQNLRITDITLPTTRILVTFSSSKRREAYLEFSDCSSIDRES